MSCLELLILEGVDISGSLNALSSELRYVEWHNYPFSDFPLDFWPYMLVELILRQCQCKQLWSGKKYLPRLRLLDLTTTPMNPMILPDFSQFPNLERLILNNFAGMDIQSNIKELTQLGVVSDLRHPVPVFPMQHLIDLDLAFSGLCNIPDAIGSLTCLETLNLAGNNFHTLPSSIKELSRLVHLNLLRCRNLKYLPELPSPAYFPRRTTLPRPRPTPYCFLVEHGFFECTSLKERERCWSMAFSWMIKFSQVNQESYDVIDIIFPRSEKPEWFNNHSVGNSISIDQSALIHHNDGIAIGIACYALFRVSTFGVVLAHLMGGGNTIVHLPVPAGFRLQSMSVPMWILYFSRDHLIRNGYLRTDTTGKSYDHHISKLIFEHDVGPNVVMHCGYRWVFEHDLNSTMMTDNDRRNSFAQNQKNKKQETKS